MSDNQLANSSESENICIVCFKNVEIYSIGSCDHAVCFECSTRMRVLCKQNECPICRKLLEKIIFTKSIEPFAVLFPKFERTNLVDRKLGIYFCTSDIQKSYLKLLEHRCNICENNGRKLQFKQFHHLKDHMRKEHELFYCDICTQNLKIFSFEMRCYNRQQLGLHRRKGDPDNTSHRGHPLCEFCDERFMDSEELFRHLRRNHLFCHFCDADGKHQFYSNMDDLCRHFREEHYLCEEGECKDMPLTAVFRTEIDCKAHKATEHTKFMTKSGAKQARTLELQFTLAPRSRVDNSRNRRYADRDRLDEESSSSYNVEPGGPGGGVDDERGQMFVNSLTPQNFPALGGTSSNMTVHSRPASVNYTNKVNSNFTSDDFPSLGGSSKPSSALTITTNNLTKNSRVPDVTITRTVKNQNTLANTVKNFPALGGPSSSSGGRSTVRLSVNNSHDSNAPNVSIQVNHRPNGSITTHITTSASTSTQRLTEAFPALGGVSTVSQPQWVPVKSKKEPKTQKVAPAPQLPPTTLEQFPTLSKKKPSAAAASNNWVNLNNFNSTSSKNSNNSNANAGRDQNKSSDTKKNEAKPSSSKQKQSSTESRMNDLRIAENHETKSKNKKKKGKSVEPEPQVSSEETYSLNIKGGTSSTEKPEVSARENKNNEFTANPAPPPGFSVKPPPGLNPTEYPTLGVASDFTFTSSSGQSYSIMPVSSYHQPANFQSRNQNLIQQLMTVLDNDSIKEFKAYSDLFKNSAYPTMKYYEYCREILGDKFDNIFPELLVLLPDIDKQQELYRVLDGKSKKALEICENCKQVIFKKELREHYNSHILENQFPTLGRAQQISNTWRK
ncbi:unnamed protein product [Phyllotreta striolata]|uniref:RING-type E3 ubiquitin transferase n=1 Tax=Phyllotreta striolata TaxID=444603 RepID=A0A9N9XSN5_PHYSR|nr:unnamed protein product [Phyllotreta striolata]